MIAALVVGVIHALLYLAIALGLGAWLLADSVSIAADSGNAICHGAP